MESRNAGGYNDDVGLDAFNQSDSCAWVERSGYWERVTYHVQMTSSAVASICSISTFIVHIWEQESVHVGSVLFDRPGS